MPAPIKLCSGVLHPDSTFWQPECLNCLRHTTPIQQSNDWIIAPDFDGKCPERMAPKEPQHGQ